MSRSLRDARRIWRSRQDRRPADLMDGVYLTAVTSLVLGGPFIWVIWSGLTSDRSIEVLTAARAGDGVALVCAVGWAAAVFVGSQRGPAVLPPTLTHVFANSAVSRWVVYRRVFLAWCLVLAALGAAAAAMVGGALANQNAAQWSDVAIFAGAYGAAGLATAAFWLVGQSFPRRAAAISVMLALAGAGAQFLTAEATPWGWIALSYPSAVAASGVAMLGLWLLALAGVLLSLVLLNRLRTSELLAQSLRWDDATGQATMLEFGSAIASYQLNPTRGRSLRAVQLGLPVPVRFVVRLIVGMLRTPGRFASGLLLIIAATWLLTWAATTAEFGVAAALGAGLIGFVGLGPLTDGMRHAARATSAAQLYGLSDVVLMCHHVGFVGGLTVAVVAAASAIASLLLEVSVSVSILSAALMAVLLVAVRLASALKGTLAPEMLTPVLTPMGDMSAVIRLIWAGDGLFLAMAAGMASLLLLSHQILAAVVIFIIGATAYSRWRGRRLA